MTTGSVDSPYLQFSRAEWAALRESTPMTLGRDEIRTLKGINEALSIDEVAAIYLPLTRLLNLYVEANQHRSATLDLFLGNHEKRPPFVIGVAGSVAVGKSTTARVLQALLNRWPKPREVALVTTDGFLYPNATLEAHNLMNKKGFPVSFNTSRLLEFISSLKAGQRNLRVPLYSHLVYDVLDNEIQTVDQPNILILEGLNVLQSGRDHIHNPPHVFVSDFIDFSIYVDAPTEQINQWFIRRFMALRDSVFSDPNSYFHKYSDLSNAEAIDTADRIWKEINEVNLHENILPTRERASLILCKGPEHAVDHISLRK
jgi:type I pantothenate kinase